MIIALAGLATFGYPLVKYWSAGLDTLVIIATVTGIPLIGLGSWLKQHINKKKITEIKSGNREAFGWPLFETFMFFVAMFAAIMLFTALPVFFFLAFVYATMAGGFAWWFFRIWLQLKAADEADYENKD